MRNLPVLVIFCKISQDFCLKKLHPRRKFYLIFPCPIDNVFPVLILSVVEKYLGGKQIRFIVTGINIDGAVVVIHHLLGTFHLVKCLLANNIGRIIALIFIHNLVTDIYHLFKLSCLQKHTCKIAHIV